ncbi:type III PLP-dependent enzyme [Glaciecola sp. SC05]|uniref:type III PLP-dependent enzyme n=1 Tax=Glaciecola sp. SC05 TaxID=1987355 RepID=UPI003528083C
MALHLTKHHIDTITIMNIDISRFYTPESFDKIKQFADHKETPFLVIDTEVVAQKYDSLVHHFPYAKIYYAVKANPEKAVLTLLEKRQSNFDIASTYELERVLAIGVNADRISFGNTIKKRKDIAYFYEKGIRLYATDSEADLRNIAEFAPGSKVYVRILTEGSQTADWPLSRKFGCQNDMAMDLIVLAQELGLVPYGLSFHVGSQQRDIGAWDSAIAKVSNIFKRLKHENDITLKMINMGGGFPAHYSSATHELDVYAKEITRFLKEDFQDDMPEIFLEPGRSLVAPAGMLVSEVVLISRKDKFALHRWIYTDVGKFSGLAETLGESIKYVVYSEKTGKEQKAVLAGPTCDSADIMYEDYKPSLPLSLEIGDRLYWFSTGAYTATYSAIEFNGFPPLKTYCI